MAFRARGKEIINSIASVSTGKLPLYKKLWENPNPTSVFAAQTITLLSDDYDFLLITFKNVNSDTMFKNVIVPKGENAYLDIADASGSGARGAYRTLSYTSDTSLSATQSRVATGTTTATYTDAYCIPLVIYGFKKDVDIQSVIASVSTEASKCMLSNGKSVESVINKGSVLVTANGVKTWSQVLNELFALIDTSKVSINSKLAWITSSNTIAFVMRDFNSSRIRMTLNYVDATSVSLDTITISNSSLWLRCNLTSSISYVSRSDGVPTNGDSIVFYY